MSYIYFSMIESNVCLPNAAWSIALISAAFIDSCNQFCRNFYIFFWGGGWCSKNLNSYNSMYNISVHFIVLYSFFLYQTPNKLWIRRFFSTRNIMFVIRTYALSKFKSISFMYSNYGYNIKMIKASLCFAF